MNPQEILFEALSNRDFALAEQALAQGAQVDLHDVTLKTTMFHRFMTTHQLDAARWLVSKGANVNAVDQDGNTVLLSLIERNRWVEFQEAMKMGVDINRANSRGVTPVLRATLFRHGLPFLKELLKAGADPNVPAASNTTALMAAVAEGFTEMTELLFDNGASPLGVDEHGQTIIMSAVLSGKPKLLKMVLDRTEEERRTGQLDVNYSVGGSVPIARAASFSPTMTLLLLRAGGDPNAQSKNRNEPGMSPLMILAHADQDGEASWVKEALAAGARPDLRDFSGNNAVFYAIVNGLDGKHAVLQALLDAGLDPKAPTGPQGASPLHVALNYEQPFDEAGEPVGPSRAEILEILLGMGFPSLPRTLVKPRTEKVPPLPAPLVIALGRRDLDCAHVLIQKGQSLSDLDQNGETVLHRMAVVTGMSQKDEMFFDQARQVLDANAPKDARQEAQKEYADKSAAAGRPAPPSKKKQDLEVLRQSLEAAEVQGRLVVASSAEMLSAYGADWNIRSTNGLTPAMSIAREDGVLMLGQIVRFHGADLSLKDPQGWTAADHAFATGADRTVHAIVAHLQASSELEKVQDLILNAIYASPEVDANDVQSFKQRDAFIYRLGLLPADPILLEARDEEGNTPLMIAAATGQDDVVRTLLAMGADPNAPNAMGETPLLHAVNGKHADIVRLLRAAGGDPNLASHNGSRASELAQARETRVDAALREPNPADMPELPKVSPQQQEELERARQSWSKLQPLSGLADTPPKPFKVKM